jgi:hypothetical protein
LSQSLDHFFRSLSLNCGFTRRVGLVVDHIGDNDIGGPDADGRNNGSDVCKKQFQPDELKD